MRSKFETEADFAQASRELAEMREHLCGQLEENSAYVVAEFAEELGRLMELHLAYFSQKPGQDFEMMGQINQIRVALNKERLQRERGWVERAAECTDEQVELKRAYAQILHSFSHQHGMFCSRKTKWKMFLVTFIRWSGEGYDPYFRGSFGPTAVDEEGAKQCFIELLSDLYFLRWLRKRYQELQLQLPGLSAKFYRRRTHAYGNFRDLFKKPEHELRFTTYLQSAEAGVLDGDEKLIDVSPNIKKLWMAFHAAFDLGWVRITSRENYAECLSDKFERHLDMSFFSKTKKERMGNEFYEEAKKELSLTEC